MPRVAPSGAMTATVLWCRPGARRSNSDATTVTPWSRATLPSASEQKILHRLVYAVAVLAVLHFWWHKAGKNDLAEPIAYALVEALLANHRPDEALKLATADAESYTTDARMRHLQAKAYAFLGKRLSEHRTQAEAYILQGQLNEAIAQLQFAQQAPDGDFYERSQVDARLREIKARHAEELKRKKP